MTWNWKADYLTRENERLREENRGLLCALLEAMGRREAANLLRGTKAIPEPITPAVAMAKAKEEYDKASDKPEAEKTAAPLKSKARGMWRQIKHSLSQSTLPIQSDTAERPMEDSHVQ